MSSLIPPDLENVSPEFAQSLAKVLAKQGGKSALTVGAAEVAPSGSTAPARSAGNRGRAGGGRPKKLNRIEKVFARLLDSWVDIGETPGISGGVIGSRPSSDAPIDPKQGGRIRSSDLPEQYRTLVREAVGNDVEWDVDKLPKFQRRLLEHLYKGKVQQRTAAVEDSEARRQELLRRRQEALAKLGRR